MTHPVDRQVGINLRRLRKLRGLSQGDLGGELGVAFQQVQKYENGTNRLSASAMYDATRALGVSVNEFYAGLPDIGVGADLSPLVRDELVEVVGGLGPRQGHLVLQLARALAGAEDAWATPGEAHASGGSG